MKLQIKKSAYVEKNAYLEVSTDQSAVSAYSWGWWRFVATDSVGNVYFNHHRYSKSTGRHQSTVERLLKRLGIKVHLHLYHYTGSMGIYCGIDRAIKGEITALEAKNADLVRAVSKKGTKKKKNVERMDTVKDNTYRIIDLRRVLTTYLDKALIPVPKVKPVNISQYVQTFAKRLDGIKAINSHKRYFKKPNGKVKWNDFARHLAVIGSYPHSAPKSMTKIKTVLGLKGTDSVRFILLYAYSKDIESMIPDLDTKEYTQLLTWMKPLKGHPNNALLLDKLHTYLTNKVNRKLKKTV